MSMQNFASWGSAMATRTVPLNDLGRRIGQDHPRATLLDHDVDLILQLRDGGMSYELLARKFEVSKSCIAHICTGRRRSQLVARWVIVSV